MRPLRRGAGGCAGDSGAGFVKVDVPPAARHGILRKLGVVNTPAVLVVKRPASVASEFKGFADRDVVAQAVADAR